MLSASAKYAGAKQPVGLRLWIRRSLLLAVLVSALYSLSVALSAGMPRHQDNFIVLREQDRVQASTIGREELLLNWPAHKPRAAILVLCRNSDLPRITNTLRQLEARFTRRFAYPYVFLNDKEFSQEFVAAVRGVVSSPAYFGQVPSEHWSYPDFIDQERAAATRERMEKQNVKYGGSESYRFMCRFFSGFFFRHPLLEGFDYYWRVEPGVKFYCNLQQDPFVTMEAHNISLGWNVMVNEIMETIPGLWPAVARFMQENPWAEAKDNALSAFVMGRGEGAYYTGCHFWSNFEIGRLSFFRSKAYLKFFDYLDKAGGFFYERWGDAPVHTIAAALMLPARQIHFFNDIGYQHDDWLHCPQQPQFRSVCDCDTTNDVNLHQPSCPDLFFTATGFVY